MWFFLAKDVSTDNGGSSYKMLHCDLKLFCYLLTDDSVTSVVICICDNVRIMSIYILYYI